MGVVSKKLRDSARGQDCTLRLPGICQGGTDTTVLCHMPSHIGLKGMGMKVPDYWACFGCHACHDVIDGRKPDDTLGRRLIDAYTLAGMERTWEIWFDAGLLRAGGDNEKPRKPSSKIVPRRPLTIGA
jgi:hypothetical protein